jgi:molybdopterin-guanine dinucleotide biosynthesis protein A
MMVRADAVGAVLAGGRSRRMGSPKALVELAGRPLIAHVLAAVEAASLEPVVVAKPDSLLPSVLCRVLREPAEPIHPLQGLLTALTASSGKPIVALACDMPFVPPSLLKWLAGLDEGAAVAEAGGRVQPLLAHYEPTVAPALEVALARGASAQEAVSRLGPRIVTEPELARFGDPELICLNVNTPADLERAAAVIAS